MVPLFVYCCSVHCRLAPRHQVVPSAKGPLLGRLERVVGRRIHIPIPLAGPKRKSKLRVCAQYPLTGEFKASMTQGRSVTSETLGAVLRAMQYSTSASFAKALTRASGGYSIESPSTSRISICPLGRNYPSSLNRTPPMVAWRVIEPDRIRRCTTW